MSNIDLCATPGLVPLQVAVDTMLAYVSPLSEYETLALSLAYKRVLADDIYAAINVPPADNSAMDGYALRFGDPDRYPALELIGTALAGQPFNGQVGPGQCVRIMTGAILPDGADTVVMQENTTVNGERINITVCPAMADNVRRAGEDITAGERVLSKGTVLGAAHLALLASLGMADVTVTRRLRVGIVATGDELTPAGQPLAPGAIYESNSYALQAKLQDLAVEVLNYGIVNDQPDLLSACFRRADSECDLLISCGGVSVGDADYVKQVLSESGQINFWQVAIKPGKPFAFGQLSQALFCGLPGNPVSSYVTFEQLVLPLIKRLSGQSVTSSLPAYLLATACAPIRKRPGRADFQRGWCTQDADGQWQVSPQGNQSSGVMSSITRANCYLLLDRQQGDVAAGETVKILPFAFI